MSDDEFLALSREAIPRLQRKYQLSEWWILVQIAGKLPAQHIAECRLDEPRRVAEIVCLRRWVRRASRGEALTVLEHEIHHVALYPLEALSALVMDSLDSDANREMIAAEFIRCNERLRSLLGRITGSGNNWIGEEGAESLW